MRMKEKKIQEKRIDKRKIKIEKRTKGLMLKKFNIFQKTYYYMKKRTDLTGKCF